MGARFIVRIEDTDVGRTRPEFSAAILDDLAWLGLDWERPVWCQSERLHVYAPCRDRLRDLGLLYPCFATRSQITAAAAISPAGKDPDGAPIYPGLHKAMTAAEVSARSAQGEPYALRLDMERALALARDKLGGQPLTLTRFSPTGGIAPPSRTVELDPARWGDVVIARKDTGTSYHLAGVIDDCAQGVTHVVRGRDLEAATDIHRLLQVLLELPEPHYHHHDLVCDADGRKLSKRNGDVSLAALRRAGRTPADIRDALSEFLAPYAA